MEKSSTQSRGEDRQISRLIQACTKCCGQEGLDEPWEPKDGHLTKVRGCHSANASHRRGEGGAREGGEAVETATAETAGLQGRGPSTTPPFWILNHCMKVQRPVFLPHVHSN